MARIAWAGAALWEDRVDRRRQRLVRQDRQAVAAPGGDRTIAAAGQETLQQLTAPAR